ncbi:hypothetical protein B0J14DRAFT_573408 [Halenospora varia]|nr:hypothetical protein B0J14DRAFT_573408 [Halenospora varia]
MIDLDHLQDELSPLISPENDDDQKTAQDQRWVGTKFWCFTILALICASYGITQAPVLQLYENRVCDTYYEARSRLTFSTSNKALEKKCKLDAIQKEIAVLISVKRTLLNMIAAFVGTIHTRGWSRRKFLLLNLGFHICSQIWIYLCLNNQRVSPDATLFSSIFLAFASGPEMRQEYLTMALADLTPDNKLFGIFTFNQLFLLVVDFLSKQVAAAIMGQYLKIPLVLGILVLCFAMFALCLIPLPRLTADGVAIIDERSNSEQYSHFTRFKRVFNVFDLPWSISVLVITFFVTSIFPQLYVGSLFLQYIEKRLEIDAVEASQLLSLSDWINVPFLIATLGIKEFWKPQDVKIVRFCSLMMFFAFLVFGFAHTKIYILGGLALCGAGQGFRMATRALLTAKIKNSNSNISDLYTGLSLPGHWIGLPFFFGAFLYLLIVLCVFFGPLDTSEAP